LRGRRHRNLEAVFQVRQPVSGEALPKRNRAIVLAADSAYFFSTASAVRRR
jgi:hypothetical protein